MDAARVDGAGALRRLWHVTLPSIAPLIVFNAITLVIGSFPTFTQAFVLTSGGPNNASLFYALHL
ncbi:MAG: sugar ABC transporter permease [Planctomycetes bacterium]|nr:sugar ABC transporter permease [Planctomycetota bacterium]